MLGMQAREARTGTALMSRIAAAVTNPPHIQL